MDCTPVYAGSVNHLEARQQAKGLPEMVARDTCLTSIQQSLGRHLDESSEACLFGGGSLSIRSTVKHVGKNAPSASRGYCIVTVPDSEAHQLPRYTRESTYSNVRTYLRSNDT